MFRRKLQLQHQTILFCVVSFFLGVSYHAGLLELEQISKRVLQQDAKNTSLNHVMLNHTYLLNDPTIPLSPHVPRVYLDKRHTPPYKLILSDYGWNHPDITKGLQYPRSLRMRELLQGIVDHSHFDPTIHWSDVVSVKQSLDPNIRYYIFFDVELCFMSNYPRYGTQGDMFYNNADLAGGRTYKTLAKNECFNIKNCHYIPTALETVHKYPNALLVAPECRGWGPSPGYRATVSSKQLALVSSSSHRDQLHLDIDQGLPPPCLNAVQLTPTQIDAVKSCSDDEERPYLVSFVGSYRPNSPRNELFQLNNNHDVLMLPKADFQRNSKWTNMTYHDILVKSKFAAAPRGDNLFSFRFTEVLSAGAIPVVHSDGWVMPLRPELVNWSESCAIIIPEAQMNETERILRAIGDDERCRRQRNCFDLFEKYFATPSGTIRGVIEGLELKFAREAIA
ncbi:hypothetical protein MPSEU_000446600 [Mayamaea pseudoterrestris]|nr:hypothetical protein MPSEU_000446600 [Mayamaea pseudoterrestris]